MRRPVRPGHDPGRRQARRAYRDAAAARRRGAVPLRRDRRVHPGRNVGGATDMAALVQTVCNRSAGADISATAPGLVAAGATGDSFPAGPNSFLRVKNGNAAAVVVTVNPPAAGAPLGTTVAPLALPSVAATTGDRIFGPFPVNPFPAANGNVTATYPVTATAPD